MVRDARSSPFARPDLPLDRLTYVRLGTALMALKYLVDAALIGYFAGVTWTPLDYLLPMISFNSAKVALFPVPLSVALLVWTLPFIWIGVTLSVRRAVDAGIFPGVVVAFFIPFLNHALMLVLALAPCAPAGAPPAAAEAGASAPGPAPRAGGTNALAAIATGSIFGLAAAIVSVMLVRTYGASVFLGVPFAIGLISGLVANYGIARGAGETIAIGQTALAATGGTLILFSLEGGICLAMAVPLASPVAALGSLVGSLLARGGYRRPFWQIGLLLLLVWMGARIEAAMPAPPLRMVKTAIDIDAPPAVVWRHVIGFREIAEPPAWYFRTGLAYPLRARMTGRGAGAVRYCEFTTGAFVEPITVWDEPRVLAFDVVEQPPPLEEWSPFARVYAPHLEGFFKTSRGEFRLVALDGHRTRLEGRTWYALDMQPGPYWTAIADTILHAIHRRVLEHVKQEAQPLAGIK